MGALLVLAAIVILALLVVRLGAAALMRTGLSRDTARFQAYSAFFGVGFTTREAELVVNHPVRRRIIRDLIIAGNVGVLSALTSVLIAFLREHPEGGLPDWQKALFIVGGVLVLAAISTLKPVTWAIDKSIEFALRRSGSTRAADYELLLRVHRGYTVSEVEIEPGHWIVGKTLRQCRLTDLGIIVLGIARSDGSFIGTPEAETRILAADVLTLYGIESRIKGLADLNPAANALEPDTSGSSPAFDR